MTPEKRNQIAGEALEALTQSKKTLAALKLQIADYAQQLKGASEYLLYVLVNPLGPTPSSQERSKKFLDSIVPTEMEAILAEFQTETANKNRLEEAVREFGR
jgi:hypothetical protein